MKKFILLFAALALSTSSVFARSFELSDLSLVTLGGPTDPLPADQAKSVKEAVDAAISQTTFTCTSATGSFKKSGEAQKALRNFYVNTSVQVYVMENGTQPILKFLDPASAEDLSEATGFITTSSDFKSILSMNGYREAITTVRTNVGTILNPEWKDVQKRTLKIEATCTADSK
jgi:hypothetical protein